jgi:hypothetical protein
MAGVFSYGAAPDAFGSGIPWISRRGRLIACSTAAAILTWYMNTMGYAGLTNRPEIAAV